jgi:hypothetical protein
MGVLQSKEGCSLVIIDDDFTTTTTKEGNEFQIPTISFTVVIYLVVRKKGQNPTFG